MEHLPLAWSRRMKPFVGKEVLRVDLDGQVEPLADVVIDVRTMADDDDRAAIIFSKDGFH
ncbi:hypothetical protein JQK88_10455 [Mesorhizobium caraganae]|uniref:hypothetical protein n=1 Tax=Mesorhizobium caraganae TaxID=483206 RepID=UPI001939C387|nr:hypothetical protein [Mesorhizobium caraganae]MBM2711667.1 hypothetical protein [Mesorhizobium caraganae]